MGTPALNAARLLFIAGGVPPIVLIEPRQRVDHEGRH
jgi:hypothetical protein